MNKAELISAMAEKTALSKKDSEKALNAFMEIVEEELKKGEKVQLIGFGTFEVKERKARNGVVPGTSKKIKIEASMVPKFKAGASLKNAVQ